MSPAQPIPSALPEPAPSAKAEPLSGLAPGTSGVIESLDASAVISGRLLDLGFVPGTPVRVIRRAPLGDPVVFELRGYRICLRAEEARHVRVRPE